MWPNYCHWDLISDEANGTAAHRQHRGNRRVQAIPTHKVLEFPVFVCPVKPFRINRKAFKDTKNDRSVMVKVNARLDDAKPLE